MLEYYIVVPAKDTRTETSKIVGPFVTELLASVDPAIREPGARILPSPIKRPRVTTP